MSLLSEESTLPLMNNTQVELPFESLFAEKVDSVISELNSVNNFTYRSPSYPLLGGFTLNSKQVEMAQNEINIFLDSNISAFRYESRGNLSYWMYKSNGVVYSLYTENNSNSILALRKCNNECTNWLKGGIDHNTLTVTL